MAISFIKSIRSSVQYWWLFLLTGILLIIIGLWVFSSPVTAYLSLSILFAVGILVSGIFEIIFAIANNKTMESWGWILASGILDLFIGIYLSSYPMVTVTVLPFILGFWLLFRGFMAIGLALEIRSYGAKDWGWQLFLAILILFLGFMVLANPAFGVANIIVWTGLAFIAAGIFRIYIAMKLRGLKKRLP